ncbi:MAG: hydroxyphenylacetyl-CoA thioesterase PaaI [Pseudomonadota bacterium]
MTPEECAERCAKILWERDNATKAFGISLLEIAPGQAVMELEVSGAHINGHKICHGGIIYALADTAFSLASNSYNQIAISYTSNITLIGPAKEGDVLVATAMEVGRYGSNGIFDVQITNQSGVIIAEYRGHSRTLAGKHFEE